MNDSSEQQSIVAIRGLSKHYVRGGQIIPVLVDINLDVAAGDFVALMGPSGSGKSTLMNLIGCLDTPNDGEYWLNGLLVSQMSDDALARVRNKEIGFVFQTFNLLPRATALHNVELPLVYAGVASDERKRRAKEALDRVQLSDRMDHRPNELSGGQRQRVAIARALVPEPKLLICDEPVSALDASNRAAILALLRRLRDETGASMVVISHDLASMPGFADRIAVLCEGIVVENRPTEEIFAAPKHPYTRLLLEAASVPNSQEYTYVT